MIISKQISPGTAGILSRSPRTLDGYSVVPIKKKFWDKQGVGLLSRTIQWKPWWRKPNNFILLYGKRRKVRLREIFYDEFDGITIFSSPFPIVGFLEQILEWWRPKWKSVCWPLKCSFINFASHQPRGKRISRRPKWEKPFHVWWSS